VRERERERLNEEIFEVFKELRSFVSCFLFFNPVALLFFFSWTLFRVLFCFQRCFLVFRFRVNNIFVDDDDVVVFVMVVVAFVVVVSLPPPSDEIPFQGLVLFSSSY